MAPDTDFPMSNSSATLTSSSRSFANDPDTDFPMSNSSATLTSSSRSFANDPDTDFPMSNSSATRHKLFLIVFLSPLLLAISCKPIDSPSRTVDALPFIKGVYGNPGTLLEAGYAFDELGMNAIFVRSYSLDQALHETARTQNTRIYVEFPTLLGRNYVEENPGAWPIDETGERSPPADWFMGVCPTDPDFKQFRERQLRTLMDTYQVDGIFLDYVHWHAQFETADPILPETCFCDRCIATFADHSGTDIPAGQTAARAGWILEHADPEWRAWRSHVLNGWVASMADIVREMQPEALVGIFYCSWYPEDHGGALYRTLGIDVEAFADRADVLAPMMFHRMKDRPTTWVSEYTEWLGDLIAGADAPMIWPIVQAHNTPGTVTPEEFRRAMLEGSKPPSSGIMMFSDRALLDDREKLEVMRELYRAGRWSR
jgi:hypothetical protein